LALFVGSPSQLSGQVTTVAGGGGTRNQRDGTGTNSYFDTPTAVAWDPLTSSLFIGESGGNDIRRISSNGILMDKDDIYWCFSLCAHRGGVHLRWQLRRQWKFEWNWYSRTIR
jgi:hypothetical protein